MKAHKRAGRSGCRPAPGQVARQTAARARSKLSYKSAGVDIDAGNELVQRIKKLNPQIGGFSGMFPFGAPAQQSHDSQGHARHVRVHACHV